jgi:PHD/YefM family antitoxin component YafN of YafNO toxin-antitoxin module
MKTSLQEPELITRNGKPVSVILPIEVYREMLERLEDVEDVAWLRRARLKPMSFRSLDKYLSTRKSKRHV